MGSHQLCNSEDLWEIPFTEEGAAISALYPIPLQNTTLILCVPGSQLFPVNKMGSGAQWNNETGNALFASSTL